MEVKTRLELAKHVANKQARRALAVMAAGAMAAPAFAQETGGIDVTDIVAKINAQVGPVGLIGSAILVVVVGIAAFRWVRRAISG